MTWVGLDPSGRLSLWLGWVVAQESWEPCSASWGLVPIAHRASSDRILSDHGAISVSFPSYL